LVLKVFIQLFLVCDIAREEIDVSNFFTIY